MFFRVWILLGDILKNKLGYLSHFILIIFIFGYLF